MQPIRESPPESGIQRLGYYTFFLTPSWKAQCRLSARYRALTRKGKLKTVAVTAVARELYLAVEDIDHSRTKTKSPQTNGICERFHRTVLNEFYRVAFRKKVYRSIDELQADLDEWIREYNEERPHRGRWCFGKTPMQTFHDTMPMTEEKMLAA